VEWVGVFRGARVARNRRVGSGYVQEEMGAGGRWKRGME
jgi:hypothetical protein